MSKMLYILGSVFLFSCNTIFAADQVWRYTDENGHISYSNVQQKGKKGEKIDIMSYPTQNVTPIRTTGAVPIPAEILKKIQSPSNDLSNKNIKPPSELPPLPGFAVPGFSVPGQDSNGANKQVQKEAEEPKWAKETTNDAGSAPSWAKDPFSQSGR